MHRPEAVSAELKLFLSGLGPVIAAWEGGSAATGFLDEHSDLDLAVVCRDDSVEQVISLMDAFLEERFGIEAKFRIPEPAWHGFSQIFYRLSDTPEFYYLDAAFIRQSVPDKFTASDRHGNAVVWFQKEPVLDPSPTPPGQVLARARQFYGMTREQVFILRIEVGKALARRRFSEAFSFHYQFVVRILGVMMNLKHRPERVDFGIRYAYRDYPPEDAALLEELLKVSSLGELRLKHELALERYGELALELAHLGREGEEGSSATV